MIAQYKTLRNQLTGDYQAFYDKAYEYAKERHYPGFYANDILMSLLDLLITAQMNHKELDTLIKEDHDTAIHKGRSLPFSSSKPSMAACIIALEPEA